MTVDCGIVDVDVIVTGGRVVVKVNDWVDVIVDGGDVIVEVNDWADVTVDGG